MGKEDNIMKHRVFAYVEDNSVRGKPSAILGLDETGEREFRAEVPNDRTDYLEEIGKKESDSPAAVAFAAFEHFCKEECGLKDCNDEVIFSGGENIAPYSLTGYVDFRLCCVDWAVVKYIDFDYPFETTHLEDSSPFINFWVGTGLGMPEPYAAHRVYQKYREYIHKDFYTEEELDRMERYIFTHLDAVYRRRGRYDAILHIAYPCAAIYRSDRARFLHVIEKIVTDYPKRRSQKRRRQLRELLFNTADLIFCEGEVDLASLDEEEKKPPLERKEYAIFAELSTDALPLVKELIEENEDRK